MFKKNQIPEVLSQMPRVPVDEIDESMISAVGFKSLPDGVEGVFLMTAKHPFAEFLYRVEEVGEAMRPAFKAQMDALGYQVVEEKPVAVRSHRPVRFPFSAMADHPDAVNDLLAIARKIDKELPVAASKPGRVEDNLHGLLPEIRKIDAGLEVPFYDRLIDFYLDAGNANYANRQAKQAIAASKGKTDVEWLERRAHELIERGFFSSLLVDAAIDAVEKAQSKSAAFDLSLSLLDAILKNKIKPNKTTLKSILKRAKAEKAVDRVDAILRSHLTTFLMAAENEPALVELRKQGIASIDSLPEAERVAFLRSLFFYALGDDGDVPMRHVLWRVLVDRIDLPDIPDFVALLGFKLCKNINFGFSSSRYGIDENFRAKVGQYLQGLDPAVIERNLDAWADSVDDYEDWARQWFFDTFITMEEMVDEHPAVFKHEGMIRACTKGLALGVIYAKNKEEFVDKLLEFLDLTQAKALRWADFVRLTDEMVQAGRQDEVLPVLEKVATWAPESLQTVFVELANRIGAGDLADRALIPTLGACAQWMNPETRQSVRDHIGRLDGWRLFVDGALREGFSIADQEVWMDIAEVKRATWREDVMGILEHDGKRYLAVGKGDYEGHLTLFVDGKSTYEFKNAWRDGNTMQTANLTVIDGVVMAQVLFGDDDDEPWKMRTLKMDGTEQSMVELGKFTRVVFARHQPWMVGLSKDRCVIFNHAGETLGDHEIALRHTGDWDDYFDVVHPMHEHFMLAGPGMAVIFKDDPQNPRFVERKIEGGLERPDGLALLSFKGSEAELVDTDGKVIEEMEQHPNGKMCGQCKEIHHASWQGTNLRGIPGEILKGSGKHRLELVTPRREHRGWVDLTNTQEKYRVEWSARDLNGDGVDEIYMFDFDGKKIRMIQDPAAKIRARLVDKIDALRTFDGAAMPMEAGVAADGLRMYLEEVRGRAGAKFGGIEDPVFAKVFDVVEEVRGRVVALYDALDERAESYPERVVVKTVKLPRSELERLHKKYLDDRYCFKAYPFPKAMAEGNVSSYREHWAHDLYEGHPNQPYLRTVIGFHMQMARETGLNPMVRQRVLDLVEGMLKVAEAPDTWMTVSANERGDGYFKVPAAVSADAVQNQKINEGMRKHLDRYEKQWKLGPFEWGTRASDTIYDLEIFGTKKLGDAILQVSFGFDEGGELIHQDEPIIGGPVQAVIDNLDAMDVVSYWSTAHDGEPKRVWEGVENPWEPLDEWMIPEEIASMRREIARLREIEPKETTAGAKGNAPMIGLMARHWDLRPEAAKVLAAMLLQPHYDRDDIVKWTRIESKKLLPHFKTLIARGLIEKHERDYVFTGPSSPGRYSSDTPVAAFKRLFFNHATMLGRRDNGRTRVALRFMESDVLREYVKHVGKLTDTQIDAELAAAPAERVAKPAGKKTPADKKAAAKSKTPAKRKGTAKTKAKAKTAKASGGKSKGKRMFELSDGSSNKFWEITVKGSDHTVRYGRIGSDGTTKTKSFDSPADARADADKLIRQKTNKGYEEV